MKGFVASRIAALKKTEPNHTVTQAEMAEPMAGFSPTTHNVSGSGPFAAASVINTLALLRDASACDLSAVLTDTIRTDIPTIPKVQLPADQPTNLPLNDLQRDYLGLIAANRGIELPHLETEDDARGFMAKIAK
jgi:hypothetical protein